MRSPRRDGVGLGNKTQTRAAPSVDPHSSMNLVVRQIVSSRVAWSTTFNKIITSFPASGWTC